MEKKRQLLSQRFHETPQRETASKLASNIASTAERGINRRSPSKTTITRLTAH